MTKKRKRKNRRGRGAATPPNAPSSPASRPPSRRILLPVLIGLAVVLIGVNVFLPDLGKAPPQASPSPNDTSATNGPARTPTRGPLEDDPTKDGWDTEAFAQQALPQLKRVAKLLVADHATEADVAGLMDAESTTGPLRPNNLETVFDDQGIVVQRFHSRAEFDAAPAEPRLWSSAGLREAITGVQELFQHDAAADETAKIFQSSAKIFRVRPKDDTVITDVLVEVGGPLEADAITAEKMGGQGRAQIKAIWRCVWTTDTNPPKIKRLAVIDYEQVTLRDAGQGLFVDCTGSVLAGNDCYQKQLVPGLDTWLERNPKVFNRVRWGDQGIALGDANGDGLDDLYICEPGSLPNRLFLQNTDGTLHDVSAAAGVDWLDHSRSALLIDLDNDGDQDLVVGTSSALLLMENDGQARFTQRAKFADIPDAHSLCAADYDNDGLVDVYACVYHKDRLQADDYPLPVPYHNATNGGKNALVRNAGAWKFGNVTTQVGLDADNHRWSLAASWEDYDNDGDLDLYVANDFGRNCLYQNDDGRFANVAAAAGVEDVGSGMSVTWGDYNHDGLMDIYVSNMFSTAGGRITYQNQFKPNIPEQTKAEFQRLAKGNTLFENVGDGTFRDASLAAGVDMARWAWGAAFVDLNNDSWEDLIVANGFLTRRDPRDL